MRGLTFPVGRHGASVGQQATVGALPRCGSRWWVPTDAGASTGLSTGMTFAVSLRILRHLMLVCRWRVEDEGLTVLVDGEVAQTVWSSGELVHATPVSGWL